MPSAEGIDSGKKNKNFNYWNRNHRNIDGKKRLAEFGQLLVSPEINKQYTNGLPKASLATKKNFVIDYISNYKYNFQQPYPPNVYNNGHK